MPRISSVGAAAAKDDNVATVENPTAKQKNAKAIRREPARFELMRIGLCPDPRKPGNS
jgi:hypothetical protein